MSQETIPPDPFPVHIRRTVYLLFLFSGASGLLFETLWTYQATLALGSSFWAVTAVLTAFMAGLGLGNFLSLRRSVWTLATYAILEATILVTGLAALFLLPQLGRILAPVFGTVSEHPAQIHLLRFVFSFAVLTVPSTAMGMTLPALAQALGGEHGSFRAVLGRLYGLNTLGAVAGVLAAEILLLPRFGVYLTGAVAALLNGIAALGAWNFFRQGKTIDPDSPPVWDGAIPRGLRVGFFSVFLAGFALLGLEVVWTRFLALFIPNSSLAFALMLATVLAGIALGGIVGGTSWIPRRSAFLLLFGSAGVLLATYAAFPLYHRSPVAVLAGTWNILRVGFILQFPVAFLSGAFFTLAGAEFRGRIASSQASAGLLVLFNTFGAATGAVAAGFLLVPKLGVEKSFVAISVVYAVAALAWFMTSGGNRKWAGLGASAWLAALVLFPFGQFRERHIQAVAGRWFLFRDTKISAFREGLTETVIYLQAREFGQPLYYRMLTNSISMSGNTVPSDRYMKQFVYWPVALHQAPKRALLICFGVGSTARALARTRELEQIDVVDLSRDVLDLSSVVFRDPATHPLKDPRVKVHVEDGRFFLQTSSRSWDIITGEPPPPDLPGVAGLYSREYFRLMKDHLSDGGIATYWLPIHSLSEPAARSILKAWSEVFDICFLWRGARKDLMLVGFHGRLVGGDEGRFLRQWEDPATLAELSEVGFETPETLGSGFIGDGDFIRSITANAEPAEDAFPKRIVAPGSDQTPMYRAWFDYPSCADRFNRSRTIADVWPEALKQRTFPYFSSEGVLTTLGASAWKAQFPDFPEIHRLCTTTLLQTPVLWALNSDRDLLRAALQSGPEVRSLPMPQFHMGARALADRDYSRASSHFLRTVGVPGMRRTDLAACLYALCMAGRRLDAERTLATVWNEDKTKAIPPEYWTWMRETFGLRVPPDRNELP